MRRLKQQMNLIDFYNRNKLLFFDPNTFFEEQRYFDVSANFKLPLYKGGKDKSNIRKYREKLIKSNSIVDDMLRKESEKATTIWNKIESLNISNSASVVFHYINNSRKKV